MQFDALVKNGFQHIERLVPADLLDEFETQVQRLGTMGLERKGLTAPEKDPLAALLQTGGEYRVRLFANLRNLDVVHQMAQSVRQSLAEAGFLEWADLQVPLVYPTLRADPASETAFLLPFHQDYATQCSKAWRLWIPLRRACTKTGTMCVIKSSHKLGFIEHDTTDPARPTVPAECLDGLEKLEIDIPRGDGVLFNPLLVHASVLAQQDAMKYILLVQIQDATTLVDPNDPADPLSARLEMTAARDAVRGRALTRN
ncbi:MAG: phytanoyl-CoA dioxygenase family protein [Tateyamaria sp.]|uniref:phytanoyl-CoA dioxygenase family protein n=1 Tax=Tateyamaria sp. TaxID=1929288 RepID=UPI00329F7A3E